MKHLLTIADETNEACSESFRRIAEKLMNLYQLQVKDNFYRIIDCEFYYSSKKHQDPYAHGHERQKSKGEWYFHGSGLDITIGNGEALGGILIRRIARVTGEPIPRKGDSIIGPLNVCTEIFKHFGDVVTDKPIHFGIVDIGLDPMGANMKTAKVFAVPRIGLNKLIDTKDKFHKKPYRFITFLHLPHKETEKVEKY
jgi:hypothetical protein